MNAVGLKCKLGATSFISIVGVACLSSSIKFLFAAKNGLGFDASAIFISRGFLMNTVSKCLTQMKLEVTQKWAAKVIIS